MLTDIYKVFLLLFHCCILLEIKLRAIVTANADAVAVATTGAGACACVATATVYMIKDAGTRTFAQPLVVFHLKRSSLCCLLAEEHALPHMTGLNWFEFFSGLCSSHTELCGSDHCWGKCTLLISKTFYTCKTPVTRQFLMLWRHTSIRFLIYIYAPPIVLGTCHTWNWSQKMPPDYSLVIRAWITCIKRNPHRVKVVFTPPRAVPSTDSCFRACEWYIPVHWTSNYFLILLKLYLARLMLPGHLCLTIEEKPFIPQAQHNLCCTYDNQKPERAYWFHRNSR